MATSGEKSAGKTFSPENPAIFPASGEDSLVIPSLTAPSELFLEEVASSDATQEVKTEAAQTTLSSKPLPDIPHAPAGHHTDISGGPKTRLNVRLVALLAGMLLLAGGGGAYMWWQQSPPQAATQEPLLTMDEGIAPTPMVPNMTAEPQPSKEQETSPLPPTEIAEATVAPQVNPASLPQPAAGPIPQAAQDTKPAPMPPPTSATSHQAAINVRQTEPEFPQEPAPKPAREQEKRPLPADAQSTVVSEIVARECAGQSGFKRIVCEEQIRLKLCTGKWGTVPGCPKYEHEDPFKF